MAVLTSPPQRQTRQYLSLVRGFSQFINDLWHNCGRPSPVAAFLLGGANANASAGTRRRLSA